MDEAPVTLEERPAGSAPSDDWSGRVEPAGVYPRVVAATERYRAVLPGSLSESSAALSPSLEAAEAA